MTSWHLVPGTPHSPPPWAQRQAGSPPMSSPSLQFLSHMRALEFVSELDALWCDYLPCSWLIAGMHLANIGLKMQPEIHWKVKPHSELEAFFPYLMPYGKRQSCDGSPARPAQDCVSEFSVLDDLPASWNLSVTQHPLPPGLLEIWITFVSGEVLAHNLFISLGFHFFSDMMGLWVLTVSTLIYYKATGWQCLPFWK